MLLVFLFTPGKPYYAQDAPKVPESYIGVVVPYQAAKTEAVPSSPPTPAITPAPVAVPAPPMMPALRGQQPAVSAPPIRPAMLSYVVPHSDGPKPDDPPPADPPQTGLTFKAASLPGIKASPAIDDTYQLMSGLLPCVLDTAIEADLSGPLPCHLPAGLQPQGCIADGSGDACGRPLSVIKDQCRQPAAGGIRPMRTRQTAFGSPWQTCRWPTISGALGLPERSIITNSSALAAP